MPQKNGCCIIFIFVSLMYEWTFYGLRGLWYHRLTWFPKILPSTCKCEARNRPQFFLFYVFLWCLLPPWWILFITYSFGIHKDMSNMLMRCHFILFSWILRIMRPYLYLFLKLLPMAIGTINLNTALSLFSSGLY